MNWEPDFSDFLMTSIAAAMNPARILLLSVAGLMVASFFKSTQGRAFVLKATPWKQKSLQFRDLLIKELGFTYATHLSNFDGTHVLKGKIDGENVRVEITAGSRGFSLFEGFTVSTFVKMGSDSDHVPNIFPKRIDAATSIHGNELVRLTFMEKPDLALFKVEAQTAVRLSSRTSDARIAA